MSIESMKFGVYVSELCYLLWP